MHRTREILRQKWALGRSQREVAASLAVSVGVVAKTVARAGTAGLDWDTVQKLDNSQLELRPYGQRDLTDPKRPEPDCVSWLHQERQKRGVTLEQPNGCGYTPHTGEQVEVELFVAVLGASSYAFAQAVWSQRTEDFLQAHMDALAFFGGAPQVFVPDQLRSAVKMPCRYEPEAQREYEDLARHYGAVIIPARPGKPKDKAKVEASVLVATRWILARLRNETFFSLEALNTRIAELLEDLNAREMKQYG